MLHIGNKPRAARTGGFGLNANQGGAAMLARRGATNDPEHRDNRMTRAEYDGDNPLRLANEIDAALAKYGLGSDRRMCKAIHFFEGELRPIAECLRT